jgi:hypothetical protein
MFSMAAQALGGLEALATVRAIQKLYGGDSQLG